MSIWGNARIFDALTITAFSLALLKLLENVGLLKTPGRIQSATCVLFFFQFRINFKDSRKGSLFYTEKESENVGNPLVTNALL